MPCIPDFAAPLAFAADPLMPKQATPIHALYMAKYGKKLRTLLRENGN